MQIVANGYRAGVADAGSGGGDPVAFGIFQPFNVHRAVHRQIEAVNGQRRLQAGQKLGLKALIGGTRDRAAGDGAGVQGGQKGRRIVLEKLKVGRRQQRVTFDRAKFVLVSQYGIERAAFNVYSANGNAHRDLVNIQEIKRE
ncbi:Uncharacterised protein [Raoultella terrigena]|uniref:Uncharacterized protein n=1 Tax=Raoultella terrigena TaxID=577 RepID=A0A4U9CT71_RAOTE|nr:Uncharacterised protein [Raoultella terrigena]